MPGIASREQQLAAASPGSPARKNVETASQMNKSDRAPKHPVPQLQGPFEESIAESNGPPQEYIVDIDARTRRNEVLSDKPYQRLCGRRWCQRPGERFHPLWKLVAQICFGLHLMVNDLAKSDIAVVKILQTHVAEFDGFVERTSEDFNLAYDDITERIKYLQTPLQRLGLFHDMLRDREFRLSVIKDNERVEHIIQRSVLVMNDSLKDIDKAKSCIRMLRHYLHELGKHWNNQQQVHAAVYEAMIGNVDGWRREIERLERKSRKLATVLNQLYQVVTYMQEQVGVVSRMDKPTQEEDKEQDNNVISMEERARRIAMLSENLPETYPRSPTSDRTTTTSDHRLNPSVSEESNLESILENAELRTHSPSLSQTALVQGRGGSPNVGMGNGYEQSSQNIPTVQEPIPSPSLTNSTFHGRSASISSRTSDKRSIISRRLSRTKQSADSMKSSNKFRFPLAARDRSPNGSLNANRSSSDPEEKSFGSEYDRDNFSTVNYALPQENGPIDTKQLLQSLAADAVSVRSFRTVTTEIQELDSGITALPPMPPLPPQHSEGGAGNDVPDTDVKSMFTMKWGRKQRQSKTKSLLQEQQRKSVHIINEARQLFSNGENNSKSSLFRRRSSRRESVRSVNMMLEDDTPSLPKKPRRSGSQSSKMTQHQQTPPQPLQLQQHQPEQQYYQRQRPPQELPADPSPPQSRAASIRTVRTVTQEKPSQQQPANNPPNPAASFPFPPPPLPPSPLLTPRRTLSNVSRKSTATTTTTATTRKKSFKRFKPFTSNPEAEESRTRLGLGISIDRATITTDFWDKSPTFPSSPTSTRHRPDSSDDAAKKSKLKAFRSALGAGKKVMRLGSFFS